MDALTYSVEVNENEPSFVTVRLHGELDMVSVPGLRQVIASMSWRWLIVDCARLTFMDSSGLNFFLHLQQQCDVDMRHLSLLNVPSTIRRVFEATEVADLFDLS